MILKAPTIVDLLRRRAEERPEFRGFRYLRDGESAEESRTWGELDRRARAIGTSLRAMGAAGTNVLMLYPPSIDFIEGYYGCLYAGAVPVPAYPPEPARLSRTLPRVQAIVADARARFALTTKQLLALAEMVFAVAPDLKQLEWLASDAVEDAAAEQWARPAVGEDTLAMLQYTSGSTGTPKGVMLTHANMLANARAVYEAFEVNEDTRWLSWLPTFHDMGFMNGVLQPLFSGCPVVGMPPTAFLEKPYRWVAAMSATKSTMTGGPNFAYDLCVRKTTPEQRAALDLSHWELAYNGAEPIRIDTLQRFAEAFAVAGFRSRAIFPCYGLAEATLIVSGGGKAAEMISRRIDEAALEADIVRDGDGQTVVACGPPVYSAKIVIVERDTTRRAPDGRVGEVWVAGPSVGIGYWQRPEESAETFGLRIDGEDGTYLRTGDLGFMHGGQLYLTGRAKDLIIIRGANHYPQDLELTVERAHPAIRPGCVAAFSLEVAGEERVAMVAEIDRRYHDRRRVERGQSDRRSGDAGGAADEALDVDQLVSVLRDAIYTRHELDLHSIVLVRAGSILKTSSGKLQRRACRQAMLAGQLEVLAEWRGDGTKRHSDVPSRRRPPTGPVRTIEPPPPPPVNIRALREASVLVVDLDLDAPLAGFSISKATEPAQALELAKGGAFAAVIAEDLALLGKLAALTPQTERVYVTGFEDPAAVRDAVAKGVITSVLSRGAGPQQIQGAVREAIETWVAQQSETAIKAIESWMVAWLAKQLRTTAQAIDLDAPVTSLGLDSLTVVEIQTALGDWLGQDIPESLLRDKSSVRSVARRLTLQATPRAAAATREDEPLAIIGMACRVPGANSPAELWQLVERGVDPIAQIPDDRMRGGTTMRWGGAIDRLAEFDATFFGMAPRDAAQVDPQHRVVLETAWQAFEDAGISPQELAGSDTGVFVGISGSDFTRTRPELALTDVTAAAAQRVSYYFNFKGPSVAVDAGDASSLTALHLAAQAVQRGECRIAIAAGVSLPLTPELQLAYSQAGLLASDGRCRPLDATADGSVLSDGCGVVVLRRASDARNAGNRIRAQLLATAVRQSGRGHGLTAPNETAQEHVMREVVQRAKVAPSLVRYAELSGRGVPQLDAIEVRALGAALDADRDRPCALGTIKSVIGDTRAASGILGVIHATLVLEHERIPAIAHLRELHPDVQLGAAFVAPTTPIAWPIDGSRRIACVHSVGLLGTVGAVVLAAVADTEPRDVVEQAQLLCISARSEAAVRALADRYATHLETLAPHAFGDFCYTANLGRAHFVQRAAVVASTPAAMRERLVQLARGDTPVHRAAPRSSARVAFAFSGRGGARADVARQLFAGEPRFRSVIQRCDRVVRDVLGLPLVASLYGGEWHSVLEDPATVAISYALADLWQSWGVHPDFVLGHDIGEYAAAAVANAMSVEDATLLAATRAKALRDLRTETHAVTVTLPEQQLLERIAGTSLAIAERNRANTFVVVGPAAALAQIGGTPAPSTPLHTPLAEPILDVITAAASRMQLRAPSMALISTVTGKLQSAPLDAAYWRQHTREPVRYDRAMREVVREGVEIFVDVGPRAQLRALGDTPGLWLSSLDAPGDWAAMMTSLGAMYERGVAPNWAGVYYRQDRRRIGLPGYAFERTRCWPE